MNAYPYGIIARTLAASAFPRIPVLRNRRFCAGLLAENMCRAYACLNLTLPDLVILKRLAAVRLVLIFGMVPKFSSYLNFLTRSLIYFYRGVSSTDMLRPSIRGVPS